MSTRSGFELGSHVDGVFPRLGLADHVEAVGGVDDHAGGHAERRLVIDDENSNGHVSCASTRKRPTVTRRCQ